MQELPQSLNMLVGDWNCLASGEGYYDPSAPEKEAKLRSAVRRTASARRSAAPDHRHRPAGHETLRRCTPQCRVGRCCNCASRAARTALQCSGRARAGRERPCPAVRSGRCAHAQADSHCGAEAPLCSGSRSVHRRRRERQGGCQRSGARGDCQAHDLLGGWGGGAAIPRRRAHRRHERRRGAGCCRPRCLTPGPLA